MVRRLLRLAGRPLAGRPFAGRHLAAAIPALAPALAFAAALAALAALAPAPAAAQSLLGFRALGVPIETAGGRALALGSLGIGLPGAAVSATDPAAPAGLLLPTVTVAMQPSWGDFSLGDANGTARTTRFPLIAVGYPVPSVRGAATVSLAGHMEQRWEATRSHVVDLGGRGVPAEDRVRTDGGTSVARLGWAQSLGDRLSLGASAGLYVGRLDQDFSRRFDSLAVGDGVLPYSEESQWQYDGHVFALGAAFDPHDLVHLAAAAEWSTRIGETPLGDTPGGTSSYSVPLRLSGGLSGRLTPRLLVAASAAYQDWSGADGYPDGSLSGSSLGYGAGLEWLAIQRETRSFPVRIGYRRTSPPFRYADSDPAESSLSLGVGLNFVEAEGIRFGWMDIAAERASRASSPLDERFWRVTVSLGISRL